MTASKKHCHVLGGMFSYGVQLLLALSALLTLLYKRWVERPQRPVKIWAMDVSKQAFGAGVAHLFNLLMALILDHLSTDRDPCAWYFVNYAIDTFLGVFVAWLFLLLLHRIAIRFDLEYIKDMGEYGKPPRSIIWLAQIVSWVVIIVMTKLVLGGLVIALHVPLGKLAEGSFSVFAGRPDLELLFVMVFAPAVFNLIQFWIQDTFLKAKPSSHAAEYDAGVGLYCPGLVPCAVACRWDLLCDFCVVHDPMARQRSRSFESVGDEDRDSDGSGAGEALEEGGGRSRRGSFIPPSLSKTTASASVVGARTAPSLSHGLLGVGGSASQHHLRVGSGTFSEETAFGRASGRRYSSGQAVGVRMKELGPATDSLRPAALE